MTRFLQNKRGLSLIELVVTMTILSILAAMVLPTSQTASRRYKEMELKRNLREIRTAIDDYKKSSDKAVAEGKKQSVLNDSGYPKSLKVLVDGEDFGGLYNYKKRFLRRIPTDPFHPVEKGTDEDKIWGLRSYVDEPDSNSWGGQDVYDVYSLSEGTAIDGTKYKDW
jgi:general secretion pathway protein G